MAISTEKHSHERTMGISTRHQHSPSLHGDMRNKNHHMVAESQSQQKLIKMQMLPNDNDDFNAVPHTQEDSNSNHNRST